MARLTVQFPDKTSEILAELSERDETSKTEILRRAIALYRFLAKETSDGKHTIAITDEDGKVVKEIIVP
jgi:predicted transcriptional regulator|tara:strand:- start:808 stop:1014 length:207 start_codon:yes stop_codon:yes gene_type:complete